MTKLKGVTMLKGVTKFKGVTMLKGVAGLLTNLILVLMDFRPPKKVSQSLSFP